VFFCFVLQQDLRKSDSAQKEELMMKMNEFENRSVVVVCPTNEKNNEPYPKAKIKMKL